VIPIGCELFRPGVLEGAWPVFLRRVTFSLNKKIQARRESMKIAADAVLHLRTVVDPARNELDDAPPEFVVAAPIPIYILPARAGLTDELLEYKRVFWC